MEQVVQEFARLQFHILRRVREFNPGMFCYAVSTYKQQIIQILQ